MTKDDNKPQGVADIVGLPDDKDKQNILILIKNYEKKNPGKLMYTINEAREQLYSQGHDAEKFGVVNKGAQGRWMFELPADLAQQIEEAYPFMFRDRKHFDWFKRNFEPIMLPRLR